jgi:hypothetical protein
MKRPLPTFLLIVLSITMSAQAPFWLPLGDMNGGAFGKMWTNPAGDLYMTSSFPVHSRLDGNGSNLLRSTDQGASWININTPLANEGIWSLAQHPTTGLLVVCMQPARDALNPAVPFNIRTTADQGQNWSLANSTTFVGDKPIFTLAYDATGSWLYAAQKQTGVRRSSDNGTTWTAVNTGLANVFVKDLERGTGGVVHVCTDSTNAAAPGRVYTWNGASWTNVSTGLPGGHVQDLCYDAASLTMYAAVNGAGTNASKVYKSVNGGAWTNVAGYVGIYIDKVVVDGNSVLHVVANKSGLYRYSGTWSAINTGLNPIWATTAVATSTNLFAATHQGLHKWDPNTNAWTLYHDGLNTGSVNAITFGPNGELLVATLNGIYRSADGGATWANVTLADKTLATVSYDAYHGQYYTGTNGATPSELWRSTDGVNWSLSSTGFNSLRVLDFAYLPDHRVVCGSGWNRPVNFSSDGISWSGGLATTMGWSTGVVSLGLAVDNAGRIWTSNDVLGVYRSDDAVPTHYTHMGFSGGNAVDIRITPQQDVFVGHSLSSQADGSLYRWRNSSNAWVTPNNLLPAGTGLINCVLTTSNKDVYAGVANGVYYSADTGVTWTTVNSGLPASNRFVQCIELGPDGHLYCGISGAGIYRSAVPAGSPYVTLNAKVFLEGPFDGISLMSDALRSADLIPSVEPFTALGFTHAGDGGAEVLNRSVLAASGGDAIVDWVLVELRNSSTPGTIIATRSALLQRDGDIVELDGISPLIIAAAPGYYHVAVRHRNHLGVMTAAPVTLGASPITIDFRSTGFSTYGSQAQKQIGGSMVLWTGNSFLDSSPADLLKYTGTNNDRDPILVRIGNAVPNYTVAGYWSEDMNLDGVVKYTGNVNDRDPILVNVGGLVPTNTRAEQLP